MSLGRIVSGGQTGVDRAALDTAVALGIPYGGWCPHGGWAEDLLHPPGVLTAYPELCETSSDDPAERTVWNVRDSDATLVLIPAGVVSAGTMLTVLTAQRLGRPLLVADPKDVDAIRAWVAELPASTVLNVAGPRESEAPGVYVDALRSLGVIAAPGAPR